MTAAQKIDNILKEKGMSRRQLAIKANIPPSTLQSAFERNREFPLSMLTSIARALDINIYYVIDDEVLQNLTGANLEEFQTILHMVQEEGELLLRGLTAFATLNGYSISVLEGAGSGIEKLLDSIKRGYSIQDSAGTSITLSIEEMNRLENEINDMVKTRLNYLILDKKDAQNG